MQIEANELEQINIEISNVIANNEELVRLKTSLSRAYGQIEELTVQFERDTAQGRHHKVGFVLPGPNLFQDQHLIDLLHSMNLVRWSIDAKPSLKGQQAVI